MSIPLTTFSKNIDLDLATALKSISRKSVNGDLEGQRVLRHLLANVANSSAISSTASETNFSLTSTISTAMFHPGRIFRLMASGIYSTTGTPTLTFRVKFGSTNLIVFAAKTGINNASNQSWKVEADIVCRTTGSSGTVISNGTVFVNTASGTDTVETVTNNTTVTVDTTVNQTLQVSLQWSASSSSNTATMINFVPILSDY